MGKLIILLDGAADEPIPELGDLTPLQALDKRFIDSIASRGRLGCTDARGYTHLFMLTLLSGREMVVPRGIIEALGYGIKLEEGEVAYRLSPASVDDHRIRWEYGLTCEQDAKLRLIAKRSIENISALKPKLHFYAQGKGILTVKSENIEELPAPPSPVDINRLDFGELDPFVRAMKGYNGKMVILPWGGGRVDLISDRTPLASSEGLVFFSKSPSVTGVAALFGLESHEVSNYHEGFKLALPRLSKNNVFLHIEETDDISHRKSPMKKVEMIEDIDVMLSSASKKLKGHRIAFIVDHGTSSISGEHIVMKVPFAMAEASTITPKRKFQETIEGYVPLGNLLDILLE
jgi:2,3-bisphosphoglycerate-independent phosphoglycerate mutase